MLREGSNITRKYKAIRHQSESSLCLFWGNIEDEAHMIELCEEYQEESYKLKKRLQDIDLGIL